MTESEEEAWAVIEPHFDAVRDEYALFRPEGASRLSKVQGTKLRIEPSVHDSDRHFAKCRDDGLLILVAPEAAGLDPATLVAVLCHEFGHAADFLYPARWKCKRGAPAIWVGKERAHRGQALRLWAQRSADELEWSADAIARAVTGLEISYCGPCMVQCFAGGIERPAGLR